MIPIFDSLAHWLADYYLLSSVLLTLTLVALAIFKQPAERRAITQSTLIALMLLAALCALPGWSMVSLITQQTEATDARDVIAFSSDHFGSQKAPSHPLGRDSQLDPVPTPHSTSVAAGELLAEINDLPPQTVDWRNFHWTAVTAGVWATGAAAVALWLVIGSLTARHLRKSAQPADAELMDILRQLTAARDARPRQISLLASNQIDVAVALGIVGPAVLLPLKWVHRSAAKSNDRDLRGVLAHELAHIDNNDLQWLAVSRALMILLWSQPLYWLVRRRMRLDQEALADAAAAELTSRQHYAEQLIAWARDMTARPSIRLSSAVSLWEGPSQLRRRIALLIDDRFVLLRNCPRKWRLAANATAFACAVALSFVTIAAPPALFDRPEMPQTRVFQHGIERLGVLPRSIFDARPAIVWQSAPQGFEPGDTLPSPGEMAADDKALYCSAQLGRLFALDVATGNELWSYDADDDSRAQQPFVTDEIVYYACGDGVVALARNSGELRWEHDFPLGAAECSPLVVDDKLFVTGYDGTMRALDAKSGKLVWQRELLSDAPDESRGEKGERGRLGDRPARPRTPASDGKTIYQPIFDQMRLVAVDCETGEVRWSFETDGWIHANPLVHDGRVYVGSQDRRMYCIDAATSKEHWRFQAVSRIEAGAALYEGRLYFGCCGGIVYCVDSNTGNEIWRFALDRRNDRSPIYCAPLVCPDGDLYIAGMEGQVYCLDAINGGLRWKFRPSENSEIDSNLATDGKRLLITTRPTNDGAGETAIFALGPAPKEAAKKNDATAKQKPADDTEESYTAPITVSGRTLDRDGNLIPGATVYLAAYTPGYKRLAETKSNELGEYKFENVELPIKRADVVGGQDAGGFEVFGMADGHAITWRPHMWFYPDTPHYDDARLDPSVVRPHAFGAEDPIKLDLTFGPPATVRGRILDDRGDPVSNVLLDIRAADSQWNQGDYKIFTFRGALSSFNERNIIPRDFKTRKTDADGRFEFTKLPRDHRFWIWVHPPGFPTREIWAVTNDTVDADAKGPDVHKYTDDIELTLERPRDVPIQVVYGDTGKPAPKVLVNAGGSGGATDDNGRVNLRLPDGEYRLHLLQRINTPYRPTETDFAVSEESVKQSAQVKLMPAAVVDIRVVDADTGAPLQGVDIWRQEVSPPSPPRREVYGYYSWEVETRISHYEQPRTGDDGKMRVMFDPGKHVIGVALEAYPEGYTPVEPDGKVIDAKPGQPQTIKFQLRKRASRHQDSENDERLALFPLAKPATAAEPAAAPEIPRPAPNTMSGQVIDEKQQPIAGAKASLFRVNRHDATRKLLTEQTTGADGRFQFNNVVDIGKEFPDGRIPSLDEVGEDFLQVAVRAQGRASESLLELPQRIAKWGMFQQLKLVPAATLAGLVADSNGNPVEGAVVSVGSGPFDHWEGFKSDRTGADGKYEIDDVAPFDIAEYRKQQEEQRRRTEQQRSQGDQFYALFIAPPVLVVDHPNFATEKASYERIPGSKDVQLEPPALLEGRVIDEVTGKPAAGAIVQAMTSRTTNQLPTADAVYTHYSAVAHTNADGRYFLTTLPAGTYDIGAEVPGRLNEGQSRIAAMVGKTTAVPDLKLVTGVPVRIRLVDRESREPIELQPDTRATVGAQPLRSGLVIRFGTTRTVAIISDGKFEIAALPGENHVWVSSVTVGDNITWGGVEPVQINVVSGQDNNVDLPVVDVNAAQPTAFVTVAPAPRPAQKTSVEARDSATAILAKNPNDYDALLSRAMALQALGEYEKAIADYEKMIGLNPPGFRNVVAHNNLAYLLAAAPDDEVRDGKRAVELALRANELRPSMPEALDTLAAAYAELGDFSKAIETQKKAIELHPEHTYFHEHLKLYEAKQPLRDKPSAKEATTPPKADDAAVNKPVEITFVVAEHGLIHDGKLIEWADVERIITALPDPNLAHPVFKFTAKGAEKHQEDVRAKNWGFRKRVPLHGHTWSSVAPEEYERYDAIRATGAAESQ